MAKFCFSLRKFFAISPAIQKIASDCGCDAVVHLASLGAFSIFSIFQRTENPQRFGGFPRPKGKIKQKGHPRQMDMQGDIWAKIVVTFMLSAVESEIIGAGVMA